MRKLILLTIFITFSYQVIAQSAIRVGGGPYIWGTGDIWAGAIELEGRYQILPLLDVGAAIDFTHYSGLSNQDQMKGSDYVFTSVSVKQLIAFNIYQGDIIKISIVGGTSIRYFNHLFLSEFLVENPLQNNYEGVFQSDRQIVLGGHIRPELHLRLNAKNWISSSASTTSYQKGNIFSGFSLGISRSFWQ